MALKVKHNETEFGVGDVVRVHQKIKEGEKERTQIFEGTVIGIKGHGDGKSYTVRRIGVQNIGIERIYPVNTPSVEKVEVSKKGTRGVRRGKLYYIRGKSKKEIDRIYSRSTRREEAKTVKKVKPAPKKASKKATKKK